MKDKVKNGVDSFCLNQLSRWKSHLNSYINQMNFVYDREQNIFFVAYESLSQQPLLTLKNLMNWLEIEVTDEILHQAISNMDFKKLQTRESQNPINSKEFFFRKGKIGSGKQEVPY